VIGNQRPADLHGNTIGFDQFQQITNACLNPVPGVKLRNPNLTACWHEHGVKLMQTIQPAERFPLFQGIETAIFIIAAIALLGLAAWLVGRRA
jgi:hypothetical protein